MGFVEAPKQSIKPGFQEQGGKDRLVMNLPKHPMEASAPHASKHHPREIERCYSSASYQNFTPEWTTFNAVRLAFKACKSC